MTLKIELYSSTELSVSKGGGVDVLEWIKGDDVASSATLAAYTAHEVRNPLAALRAMAQLTLTSSDSQVRQAMMEQIVAGIDELDQFLRQMLYLLRPESVSMQRVDIGGVLRNVVRLLAVQADQTGVDIRLRLPGPSPAAWGNADLLRHVFINLLKNALEAMPGGGPVTVSAGQCPRHGAVWVTVRDRGVGIPEPLRARILTDTMATSRVEGGGIGLPFVRQVVNDIHGGKVSFRTRTGVGTVFCVEIPGVCGFADGDNTSFSLVEKGNRSLTKV